MLCQLYSTMSEDIVQGQWVCMDTTLAFLVKFHPIFEIWESIIDFRSIVRFLGKNCWNLTNPHFAYCILHICSAEFCFTNTIRLAYLIRSNRHTQTNKLYFTQQISPNQLWFWHLNSLILFHLTQFIDCDNDPGHLVYQSYIQ